MSFQALVDLLGSVDGSNSYFDESLYLLREDLRIVSMRRATHPTGPIPHLNDDFFVLFPVSKTERSRLSHMQNFCNERSLLLRAGRRPIVMLFAFYARTRLLVAVVPEGNVRKCLDRPAAHADLLEECNLTVSLESLNRRTELTEENHRIVYDWIDKLHSPLFHNRSGGTVRDAALVNAIVRIMRLATLCGCSLSYDFTGLGYNTYDIQNFDLMGASAFVIFLAVHRMAKDHAVELHASHMDGVGLTLHAIFECADPAASFPELEYLSKEAQSRGKLFEIIPYPNTPARVHVQCALRHKELSEQDVKSRTSKCFSENQSSQPRSAPDAFENEF